MSTQDPQFGLPEAPIATKLEAAEPGEFGVPALKRGQGLNVTGLHPSWGGWFKKLRLWLWKPCALAYQGSAAQALTTGVAAALTFDTNTYDNAGIHSTSVNPTRFGAPVAGIYALWCQFAISAATAGTLIVQVNKNGSAATNPTLETLVVQNGTAAWVIHFTGYIQLNAGDYIEYLGTQVIGAGANTALGLTAAALTLQTQP